MTVWVQGLVWILVASTLAGVAYTLAAAGLASRFLRRPVCPASQFPPVSVIKPLHGVHHGLPEALARFCQQDYPGEVQIVFGVQDGADPAVAVVEALRVAHPRADIELVIDTRLHGANRKASNLQNIAERARHELLILSDADILVEADYLRRVAAAMARPGVGAASCLYVGRGEGGLWAQLSAMGIDYHFLPGAIVGKAVGLAQPCFGSTIAITAEILEAIGGFGAVANHLADDYEIGRAVRGLGYLVDIPPMVVSHHCGEASGRELIGHELRWSRTVRQIDPLGFVGSFITYPTPLAILAAAVAGFPLWSVGLIFATLGSRLCLKVCVDAATGAKAGPWQLMPVRDIISFGVFLVSFAVSTVGWQGRRFRVGADGVLLHR